MSVSIEMTGGNLDPQKYTQEAFRKLVVSKVPEAEMYRELISLQEIMGVQKINIFGIPPHIADKIKAVFPNISE